MFDLKKNFQWKGLSNNNEFSFTNVVMFKSRLVKLERGSLGNFPMSRPLAATAGSTTALHPS
jgi:hypothetical protein